MKSEKGSFVVVVLLLMLVLMAFISSIFAMNFNNMALSKAYADHKNELFEVDAAGENILRQVDDYLIELDEDVHDYMLTEKYSIFNEETIVSKEFQNYLHLNWLERVLLPSIQLKHEQVGTSELPIDLANYRGLEINNRINDVIEIDKIYIVDDYLYQDYMEDFYDDCYTNVYFYVVENAIINAGIIFSNTDYTIVSYLEDINLPDETELSAYESTWDTYDRSSMNMTLRLDITNDNVEKPQNLISRLKIVPPFSQEDTYIEFEGISPNPLFGNAISSNGSVVITDQRGDKGFIINGDIYSQEGKGELVETKQSDWNNESETYDKGVIFNGAYGYVYGNIYSRSNIVIDGDESIIWVKGYNGSTKSDVVKMKSLLYKPMATGGINRSSEYFMDLSNPHFFSDLGPVAVNELKSQFAGNTRGTNLIHFDSKGGNVIANGIVMPASLSSAFIKIFGYTMVNDDVVNTSAEISSIAMREGVVGISKPGDVGGDPRLDDGSTIKIISRDNIVKDDYSRLYGIKYNSNGVNILFDDIIMPGKAVVEDANGKLFNRDLGVVDLFTSQDKCLLMLQGDNTNPAETYTFKFIDRPAFSVTLSSNPNASGRKFYNEKAWKSNVKITRWKDGGNKTFYEYLRHASFYSNFSLHYVYEAVNHDGWIGGDVWSASTVPRMYEAAGDYSDLNQSTTKIDRLNPGYEESFNTLYDSGFLRKKFLAQTENFGFESFDMEESVSSGYIKGRPTSETGIMYYPDDGREHVINLNNGDKIDGIIFAEGDLRIIGPKRVETINLGGGRTRKVIHKGTVNGTIICLGTLTVEGNVYINYDLDVIERILKDYDLARKFFQKGALPIPWTSVEVEKSNPLMRKKDNVKRYEILEWSVNR
ncbi:hypothetical protein EZV73_11360 [Acidaminobacter sp. JC074]|uniref:DUF2572 family protein n=1 Tax=Acidaminobacter sp. JC074 TaxID=2530199 RepID=UPI001F0EE538|nr:DUF2572 family protein [Acidaminobacter sp. JC074]MCH4888175.1 hypothetical protein [Acidaminobacter sp. JC074]